MKLFNNLFTKQPSIHLKPADQSSKKAVIFDLGDVLFKTSKAKQAFAIIPTTIIHPSILYTIKSFDIKEELFKILSEIPALSCSDVQPMYNEGKKLPQIWVDWMIGKHNSKDLYKVVLAHIHGSKHDKNKKRILCKVVQYVFNPHKMIKTQKPIKFMLKLLRNFKNNGYKLYVLSNWDKESFPLLETRYAHIFKLFNGIMISGKEGIGKPNLQSYKKLLDKYQLNEAECIFIDDEKYNIQAAKSIGIHGILNDSIASLYQQLQQTDILKHD